MPTIAFFLRTRREPKDYNDDDDDDDDDDNDDGDQRVAPSRCSAWGMEDAPYKMVLCVNTSLGMGKGKIAAQCCHAAVGCFKRAVRRCPTAVRCWEYTGCAKIAVKCPDPNVLEAIRAQAMDLEIPTYLVEDAGRTQIAAGSRTVLGLGPAPVQLFEGLTSNLKLM